MRRLGAPDVGRIGPFLAEAEALEADDPFPGERVVALVLGAEGDA